MKLSPLLLLLPFIFFIQTNAQTPDSNLPNSQDSISNFQPSLAVVIGMLAIMFSLTFILLLYAKFCHRAASIHSMNNHIHDGLVRSRSLASGVDKTVVESLPFFRFSSLRGSRDGLECAVCLAKFEDVEILRLLPKCKHAFHIDCIDQWLEKHSTCPLCRRKVSADDLSPQCSSSLRFLYNLRQPSELSRQDSNLEMYVEREESRHGSSRFCIGSSFRKVGEDGIDGGGGGGGKEEEELPISESMDCDEHKKLHRFNHKIVVADAVLKNRWSNVSSSDIMFLNSEMLNEVSSARFSSKPAGEMVVMRENDDHEMMNIREEIERKRVFESKVREIKRVDDDDDQNPNRRNRGFESSSSSVMNPNEKRSMSEIVVHPRFRDLIRNRDDDSSLKEERTRRLWLPIARKTVQWFANRERRSPLSPQSHGSNVQQRLNV
ncbi:hypothetical protein C2S51_000732 [Perilla frutescens var. frutescens]|nr:hypothetical protein C2S51_000732 [Perilla frutescens var. frutescens]